MVERWEKERASWILAHAGRNAAARRRGEKLMVRARKLDRNLTGVGDSGFNEVATRNFFHRSVMREEGASNILGWLLWTLTWMFWLGVLAGPALVIAWASYGLRVSLIPQLGRLRAAPFIIAAALGTVAAGVLWFTWTPSSWPVGLLAGYLLVQFIIGMSRAAWLTRSYGWTAAKSATKASGTKKMKVKINVPAPDEPSEEKPFIVSRSGSETAPEEAPAPEPAAEETQAPKRIVVLKRQSEDEDTEAQTPVSASITEGKER